MCFWLKIFEFEKIQYFEIFVLRFYQCTRAAKANEVFGYPELPGYCTSEINIWTRPDPTRPGPTRPDPKFSGPEQKFSGRVGFRTAAIRVGSGPGLNLEISGPDRVQLRVTNR